MSHKIAKALRREARNVATPEDMHLVLTDLARKRRQQTAHVIKPVSKPHGRHKKTRRQAKIRRAAEILRRGHNRPVDLSNFVWASSAPGETWWFEESTPLKGRKLFHAT